jgi:hypothetical protein
MALKKSGVMLVAEGYSDYMKKMKDINKAHTDAFGKPFKPMKPPTQELSGFNKFLGEAVSGFTDMGPLIGRVTGAFLALGPAIVAVKLVDWLNQASQLALTVETLDIALRTMAEHAGYSGEQVDFAVASLKKQGITTEASIKALQRLTRAEISWAEASKLAAIAQGSAVGTNMTSSEAFERLVLGIQKMEPELLDELGITLSREKAYKQMSQQLGKSSKDLTDAEKKQAILNQVYAQSAVVMDVYDAAMGTAGKQQKSLMRLQEETALSVGNFTKSIATASIAMQTDFWTGAQQAAKGLEMWGPVLEEASRGLSLFSDSMSKQEGGNMFGKGGIFDLSTLGNLGKGLQAWARTFVDGTSLMAAAYQALKFEIINDSKEIAGVFQKLASGDFTGAWEEATTLLETRGEKFTSNFQSAFSTMMDNNRKKFPDLYKAWEDVGDVAEVSLDKQVDGSQEAQASVEELTNALKEQQAVLEATKGAFEKAKSIQETYTQATAQAKEDLDKGLAEADAQYTKDKLEMEKAQAEETIAFDKETYDTRKKMVDDFNRERQRSIDAFRRDQENDENQFRKSQEDEETKFRQGQLHGLQRHMLDMAQAARRQRINDRWMRAEGDVLGLMRSREDFGTSQTEATENFNLDRRQANEGFQLQQELARENFRIQQELAQENFNIQERLRKEDHDRQMAEFDANRAMEREKMLAGFEEEAALLLENYEKQKADLHARYEEALAAAKEQRDKQLEQLGDSLKAEGELTEEGMKEIASKISEVFGDDAAGDKLIQGWADRTTNKFGVLIDDLSAQIAVLKAQMESVENAGPGSGSGTRPSSAPPPYTRNGNKRGPGTRGMRQGGSGVVTGPAVFEVEPGVREAFMFAPLPTGGPTNLNVNMKGGFNITGGEVAGKAAVEEALNTMTEEFVTAVQKLSKMRGR